MKSKEYREAAVEVLDILNNTDEQDVAKIPKSFIKFLKQNASRTYKPNFNHEQPITKLNIKKQTKEILGFIYITWWCDSEKRKEYKKLIHSKRIKN